MTQIDSDEIKSIGIIHQPDGTLYLVLNVSDEVHASILNTKLTGIINLKIDTLKLSANVLLSVYIMNYYEVMRLTLYADDVVTKQIIDGIQGQIISYVFAAYPDAHRPVNLFGQLHTVSY
jgi:hypothetical protein